MAERVPDERLREMVSQSLELRAGASGVQCLYDQPAVTPEARRLALQITTVAREAPALAAELLALRRRVEALEAIKRAARESYSWMGDVLAEQEDFPILGSLSREGCRLTADLSVAFAALAALDAQGMLRTEAAEAGEPPYRDSLLAERDRLAAALADARRVMREGEGELRRAALVMSPAVRGELADRLKEGAGDG